MLKRLNLILLAGSLCSALTLHAADVLIDSSFGEATAPVLTRQLGPSTQVTGVFPEGWMEDTSWAHVSADCKPGQQDGIRFLRITTNAIQGRGRVDFCHTLPTVQQTSYYRLRMKVRAWNWNAPAPIIGVRHLHTPWDYVWSESLPNSSNWSEIDVRFELKPDAIPIALFIQTQCVGGKLDVAYVHLEEIPEANLRAEAEARYPGHGPANLFRNSRFPLGMQSGWYIKRECSDQESPAASGPAFGGTWGNGTICVRADAANPGPTGAPSLAMSSIDAHAVTLSSEPFLPAYPFVEHAVTFSANGGGSWRVRVLVDGDGSGPVDGSGSGNKDVLAQTTIAPTKDWKRYEIPFTPHKIAEGYRVEFVGTKTLRIDGLQVGPKEKAGTYASAGACEVALALSKSDAADARIQFDDEPAKVDYCVTGDAAGAQVKFRVMNLYHEETRLPDVPVVTTQPITTQTLDFSAALKNRPLGAFRIDAWVEKDGKTISPLNELVINRLRRPHYWGKDAPDSPFGINMDAVRRNIIMAKAVGINWERLHDIPYIWWSYLEPEKGQWTFYDGEIALFRELNMKLLGELATAPKWASFYADTGKTTWVDWDRWFEPKNMSDFAAYVTKVATRYKGEINDWDVWNEPWTYPFWSRTYNLAKPNGIEGYTPGVHAAADYAELMKTAYTTLHGIDPSENVLGFDSTGHSDHDLYRFSGTEWTTGVFAAGGLNWCDTLCYHHYEPVPAGYPGDGNQVARDVAFGPVEKALGSLPKPVWMTEGSGTSGVVTGFGLAKVSAFGPEVDNYDAISDHTARELLSLLSEGNSKLFLYDMSQYVGRSTPTYIVLLTPDGYLHPSGVAHSNFAWLIEDKKFVRVREVSPGIYAFLFRGGDRAVVVLSSREDKVSFPIPTIGGADVLDLYGNPLPANSTFTGHLVYLAGQGTVADQLETTLAPKP